ncbi:MAG: TetR family transcriptional regulator [Desulfuromusa sp.]|nr:TetR family transcriptional regulator [Desulfuromusa sp.]
MKLDTETRQQQIIQAAILLIHHGGIQNLTIKNIAGEVGFSEQAIYRHFDNKQAILAAIINHLVTCCGGMLDEVSDIEDPLLQIRRFMEIHIEHFANDPAFATIIFSEEIFQYDSPLALKVNQLLDKHVQHITTLVTKAQAAGETSNEYSAGDLAFMIIGSLRFLITMSRLSVDSFNMKERGRSLIETIMATLKQEQKAA